MMNKIYVYRNIEYNDLHFAYSYTKFEADCTLAQIYDINKLVLIEMWELPVDSVNLLNEYIENNIQGIDLTYPCILANNDIEYVKTLQYTKYDILDQSYQDNTQQLPNIYSYKQLLAKQLHVNSVDINYIVKLYGEIYTTEITYQAYNIIQPFSSDNNLNDYNMIHKKVIIYYTKNNCKEIDTVYEKIFQKFDDLKKDYKYFSYHIENKDNIYISKNNYWQSLYNLEHLYIDCDNIYSIKFPLIELIDIK